MKLPNWTTTSIWRILYYFSFTSKENKLAVGNGSPKIDNIGSLTFLVLVFKYFFTTKDLSWFSSIVLYFISNLYEFTGFSINKGGKSQDFLLKVAFFSLCVHHPVHLGKKDHLSPVYKYFCAFFIACKCSIMDSKKKSRNMIELKKEIVQSYESGFTLTKRGHVYEKSSSMIYIGKKVKQ